LSSKNQKNLLPCAAGHKLPCKGGCTRGVSAKRFETPLVGGAASGMRASAVRKAPVSHTRRPRRWRAACRRRGGNPPRPGLPPEGETGKGEIQIPRCRRLFLSLAAGWGMRQRRAFRLALSAFPDAGWSLRLLSPGFHSHSSEAVRFRCSLGSSIRIGCGPLSNILFPVLPRRRIAATSQSPGLGVGIHPAKINLFLSSPVCCGCFYAATLPTRVWAWA
jgi:hypothetical protein